MKNSIYFLTKIHTGLSRKKGSTMIEYALIISLISIAAVVSLTALKTEVSTVFSSVASSMN